MKRYITYGYLSLGLFFLLVLHKGMNEIPYAATYLSHVWSGAAPYYGIEVDYITPEEVERRKLKLSITSWSGVLPPAEKEKIEPIKLKEPNLPVPIQPIGIELQYEVKVQPGEVVNASSPAGLSENHLHD